MLNIEKKNPTWRDAAETFTRCLKEVPNTERAYVEATKNLKCPKETLRFASWLARPGTEPEPVDESKMKFFKDDNIVWTPAEGHELCVLEETYKEGCSYVRLESRPIRFDALTTRKEDEEDEKIPL